MKEKNADAIIAAMKLIGDDIKAHVDHALGLAERLEEDEDEQEEREAEQRHRTAQLATALRELNTIRDALKCKPDEDVTHTVKQLVAELLTQGNAKKTAEYGLEHEMRKREKDEAALKLLLPEVCFANGHRPPDSQCELCSPDRDVNARLSEAAKAERVAQAQAKHANDAMNDMKRFIANAGEIVLEGMVPQSEAVELLRQIARMALEWKRGMEEAKGDAHKNDLRCRRAERELSEAKSNLTRAQSDLTAVDRLRVDVEQRLRRSGDLTSAAHDLLTHVRARIVPDDPTLVSYDVKPLGRALRAIWEKLPDNSKREFVPSDRAEEEV